MRRWTVIGAHSDPVDIHLPENSTVMISETENKELCECPGIEEVREVVFSLKADSSPGPDGFTGLFYKAAWDIIKNDLHKAVREFFNGFPIPRIIGATQLVLLKKNETSSALDNYRPISLCNVAHKILSKLLYNKLKEFMQRIVCQEQVGFIPGRVIQDNICIAFEKVQEINKRSYGGNIMMKLDMSKAYDRLSWGFILRTLRWYGFSHAWCNLIYHIMSNCWYSILWGGKSYGFFKSNRGVRQGDPISPCIFVLAMNVFSKMLNKAVSDGHISAYGHSSCGIHHLLYADDILIFSNGKKRSFANLMNLIHDFCNMSGQDINQGKSALFFSNSISSARKYHLLNSSGFRCGTFPTTYLGAPLFPGRAKIEYFNDLEDKVRRKVNSWAKNLLSIGGRLTLIQSVLNSIPLHIMSILPIPKTCLNNIQKLIRNFLWDYGDTSRKHWVNWTKVCRPKDEGGLALDRLWTSGRVVWARWPGIILLARVYGLITFARSIKRVRRDPVCGTQWNLGFADYRGKPFGI